LIKINDESKWKLKVTAYDNDNSGDGALIFKYRGSPAGGKNPIDGVKIKKGETKIIDIPTDVEVDQICFLGGIYNASLYGIDTYMEYFPDGNTIECTVLFLHSGHIINYSNHILMPDDWWRHIFDSEVGYDKFYSEPKWQSASSYMFTPTQPDWYFCTKCNPMQDVYKCKCKLKDNPPYIWTSGQFGFANNKNKYVIEMSDKYKLKLKASDQDNCGDGIVYFKYKGKEIGNRVNIKHAETKFIDIPVDDKTKVDQICFQSEGRHGMYNANLYGIDDYIGKFPDGNIIDLTVRFYTKKAYYNRIMMPNGWYLNNSNLDTGWFSFSPEDEYQAATSLTFAITLPYYHFCAKYNFIGHCTEEIKDKPPYIWTYPSTLSYMDFVSLTKNMRFEV